MIYFNIYKICFIISIIYLLFILIYGFIGVFTDIPNNICSITKEPRWYIDVASPLLKEKSINPLNYNLRRILDTPQIPHKYNEIPILSVHGHRGSFAQIFNLVVELREQWDSLAQENNINHQKILKPEFFTVDMLEDASALHGNLITLQSEYVNQCLKVISSLYPKGSKIIIIAHSMGGVVVRNAMTLPSYIPVVQTLITLNSPHIAPIIEIDVSLVNLYHNMNKFWRSYTSDQVNSPLKELLWISISSGIRDTLVPSSLGNNENLFIRNQSLFAYTTDISDTQLTIDHDCIMWCSQFLKPLILYLFREIHIFFPLDNSSKLKIATNIFKNNVIQKYNGIIQPLIVPLNSELEVTYRYTMLKKLDSFKINPLINENHIFIIPLSLIMEVIKEEKLGIEILSNVNIKTFDIGLCSASNISLISTIKNSPDGSILSKESAVCNGDFISYKNSIINLPSYPASFSDRIAPKFTFNNNIFIPDNWPSILINLSKNSLIRIIADNKFETNANFFLIKFRSSALKTLKPLKYPSFSKSWLPYIIINKRSSNVLISDFYNSIFFSSSFKLDSYLSYIENGHSSIDIGFDYIKENTFSPMIYAYSSLSKEGIWTYDGHVFSLRFLTNYEDNKRSRDRHVLIILADPLSLPIITLSHNSLSSWIQFMRYNMLNLASSIIMFAFFGFYLQLSALKYDKLSVYPMYKFFYMRSNLVVLLSISVPSMSLFFYHAADLFTIGTVAPIILSDLVYSFELNLISALVVSLIDILFSLLVLCLIKLKLKLNYFFSNVVKNATVVSSPKVCKIDINSKDSASIFCVPKIYSTFPSVIIVVLFFPIIVLIRMSVLLYSSFLNLFTKDLVSLLKSFKLFYCLNLFILYIYLVNPSLSLVFSLVVFITNQILKLHSHPNKSFPLYLSLFEVMILVVFPKVFTGVSAITRGGVFDFSINLMWTNVYDQVSVAIILCLLYNFDEVSERFIISPNQDRIFLSTFITCIALGALTMKAIYFQIILTACWSFAVLLRNEP